MSTCACLIPARSRCREHLIRRKRAGSRGHFQGPYWSISAKASRPFVPHSPHQEQELPHRPEQRTSTSLTGSSITQPTRLKRCFRLRRPGPHPRRLQYGRHVAHSHVVHPRRSVPWRRLCLYSPSIPVHRTSSWLKTTRVCTNTGSRGHWQEPTHAVPCHQYRKARRQSRPCWLQWYVVHQFSEACNRRQPWSILKV